MTDLQRMAFKAGYDGWLFAQFMSGVREKEKTEAMIYFMKGVTAKHKEISNEIKK